MLDNILWTRFWCLGKENNQHFFVVGMTIVIKSKQKNVCFASLKKRKTKIC